MFIIDKNFKSKEEMYNKLLISAKYLFEGIHNNISNMSNASALLSAYLPNINWVGFYLHINNELQLGPFQGLPACTSIKLNRGVCGKCASTKETQIVPNVHEFPGHIACDSNSSSEIVLPILLNNQLYGVLDIDSPVFQTFDSLDALYLEQFIAILLTHLDF